MLRCVTGRRTDREKVQKVLRKREREEKEKKKKREREKVLLAV